MSPTSHFDSVPHDLTRCSIDVMALAKSERSSFSSIGLRVEITYKMLHELGLNVPHVSREVTKNTIFPFET